MKLQKIRAIIIDDIKLARASLRADIEDHCEAVEIVGEANGVVSGLKMIKLEKPDLVFLDIHMADGEGFDILEILGSGAVSVIFTTASDKHAIQAFQHDAVDYLLKPIDTELLVKAVEKLTKHRVSREVKVEPLKPKNKQETITLSTLDDLRIVKIVDIVRLEADGNYTTVYELGGVKTMVSKSIKEFEKVLSSFGFYRSHQSHLVDLSKVKTYLKSEGGFLKMVDGSEVPVSIRKKAEVVQILKGKN